MRLDPPVDRHRDHVRGGTAPGAVELVGGRFWEMHDLLLQRQRHLEDPDLRAYAAELELDLERFAAELEAGVHRPRVEEDIESGRRSGVFATPTFFVAEERYEGFYDRESLHDALEEAATAA